MAPKHAVEAVDALLQDIMQNNKLFDGKTVVFGGDFRQISREGQGIRGQQVAACLKSSYVKIRIHDESAWKAYLFCNDEEDQVSTQTTKQTSISWRNVLSPPGELINHVFGPSVESANHTFRNDDAWTMNSEIIDLLPGQFACSKSISSAITAMTSDALNVQPELLIVHSLNLPSIVVKLLAAKLGPAKRGFAT